MAEAAVVEVPVLPDLTSFGTLLTAGLRGSMGSISGVLSGITKNFGLIAGAGIAAGIGTSIRSAVEYEEAFRRIDAVTNASAANLSQWKEQILDVSSATAQAPQELADAVYFLASAGLEMNQVMGTLELSAKAAAVGLGDTHTISLLAAQAMNAFAADGLTAVQVMDSLTAAVREGSVEPDALAQSLGRVMPIAAATGVEFGEVTGAIAAMTNAGLDAYESTTALRQLLANTVAPSVEAANAMSQMGISTQLLRDTIREKGLLEGLDLLGRKSKMNFDIMRRIIPNIRALAGFFNLTRDEMKQATEIIDATTNATGSLQSAWETTQDNVSFQLEQLGNNFEVLKVRTGEAFLPLVNIVVRGLNAMMPVLTLLANNAHLVVAAFLAWKFIPVTIIAVQTALYALGATAAGDMLIGVTNIKGLTTALTNMIGLSPALTKFVSAMGGLGPAAIVVAGAVTAVSMGLRVFNFTAQDAEKSVDGIKAFGEALEVPRNVLDQIRDSSTGFVHNLSIFSQQFLTAGQSGAELFGEYEEKLLSLRKGIMGAVGTGASAEEIMQNLGQSAQQVVAAFDLGEVDSGQVISRLTEIAAGTEHITDAQKANAQSMEAALKLGIISAEDMIPKFEKVDGLLASMGTNAQQFAGEAVQALNKGPPQFNKFINDTLKKASQQIEELGQSFAESINFGAEALDSFVTHSSQSVGTFIANLGKANTKTKAFGRDLLEIARNGGEALAQSLASAGTEGASAAARIADGTDKMRDRAISAFNKVTGTAASAGGKISTAILGTLESIESILNSIANKAFNLELNLDDGGAEAKLRNINSLLATMPTQKTITVDYKLTGRGMPFDPDNQATGGPVVGGTPYIVGEVGPELFVPKTNGTIVPNNKLQPRRGPIGEGGSGRLRVTLDRRHVLDEIDHDTMYRGW